MHTPTDEQIAAWYPRLFRTALRMTGDLEAAGDFTQQAFCKALAAWDRFDGKSRPTTWLHRILVNCIRDAARRRAVRRTGHLDEWALVPAPAGPGAVDRLDRREQLGRLRQAVEDLSDTLRPAFVATMLDGYSYAEASELLGVPVGTVASRVHEARRQLREVMHEAFPEALT